MSVELTTDNTLRSRNPANMRILGEVNVSTGAEIFSAVAKARVAFLWWSQLTLETRLSYVDSFREALITAKDRLARLITCETGKPLI